MTGLGNPALKLRRICYYWIGRTITCLILSDRFREVCNNTECDNEVVNKIFMSRANTRLNLMTKFTC